MIQRKSWFSSATVMFLFFFVLAGAPSLAAKDPVVIRLWDMHIHDKKFRKDIFKEFNAINPDIKVEYTSQIGSAYDTVLEAAFRINNPPEIFVPTSAASMSKLVEMGRIKPLDDIAPSREALDKFKALFNAEQMPFMENVNVFKGKTYSWPTKGNAGNASMMLYYNTKLFREAGLKGAGGGPAVPETWEDMRLFAKKITQFEPGKTYGIILGSKDPGVWRWHLFYTLAFSTGWSIYAWGFDFRTGRLDYHHPGFRRAIQLWLDMKKDGSIFPGDVSMDDEQAKFKFAQNLAGMYFGGEWTPGGFISVNPDLEFDAVQSPTEKRGERKGTLSVGELAGVSEYVISSRITNPEPIWQVVTFMTSQKYQEEWVKAGGGISVFPEYNKPEFFPHPTLAKMAQIGSTGKATRPPLPDVWPKTWELWDPGRPDVFDTMQGQWTGLLGWEAWDDLERRTNEALDKAMAEASKKYGIKITQADFSFPDWDPAKPYPPPKTR